MTDLSILSVGTSSPLGIDARQTALLSRSTKAAPRSSPFTDERGNSIGTIRCLRLDDELTGHDRLLALAAPALEEALWSLPPMLKRELEADRPVVLLLGMSEPFDGETDRDPAALLGDIAKQGRLRLDERSSVIRLGHAGYAALLARAAMFTGDVRVIVGAVDSFHDESRLRMLDRNYRVQSTHGENGFVPSEAASFACVTAGKRSSNAEPPLASVRLVACGEEQDPYPPMARTLTKLLRDDRFARPLPWVLVDTNGEQHRMREWTFASMRNREVIDADPAVTRVDQPYGELGELGAATGAVYLSNVAMAFKLGFAPAASALVVTSSEGTERGLFYLEERE